VRHQPFFAIIGAWHCLEGVFVNPMAWHFAQYFRFSRLLICHVEIEHLLSITL
jgi:Gpi18-like mannosyltransferase